MHFDSMFGRCLESTEEQIQNEVIKIFYDRLEEKNSPFNINIPAGKIKKVQKILK